MSPKQKQNVKPHVNVFVPSSQTAQPGKKIPNASAVTKTGGCRRKAKVQHQGPIAEMKKFDAAVKAMKTFPLNGFTDVEMIQNIEEDGVKKVKIYSWKSPKMECTYDRAAFFLSGKNEIKTMTKEEYDKENTFSEEKINEITKGFKEQLAAEGVKPEEVPETQEEEKKEEEIKPVDE